MKNREVLNDHHTAALARERALWQQVIGKGPLSPDFDQPLFEQWLAAVGQTALASKALRKETGDRPSSEFYSHPS